MRTKLILLATLCLLPLTASAQFDFGGGDTGPSQPWKEFKLNPKTRIKLDFRNANVDMVVSMLSKASGINIVKDPALTGPITVTSAGPVSLEQAFEIFNATLSLKSFEMRKEGSLLVIRQRRQDRGGQAGGANPFGGMSREQIEGMFGGSRAELKVYPIKYANASQVARVLNEVFAQQQDPVQQFMQMMMGGGTAQPQPNLGGQGGRNQGGRGGQFGGGQFNRFGGQAFGRNQSSVRASSDDFSNSVIVNAPTREQEQVARLIKELDKETDAPQNTKVYRLTYAFANDIAASIQNVLTANAPKGRGGISGQNVPFEQRIQQAFRFGNTQAAFGTVVSDMRTNSLIVTATDESHVVVSSVIKELDSEVKLEASTFVVPLNNARASDLATLLNQAFGTRANTGQRASTQAGTRSPQQRTTGNQQPRNQGGNNQGGGGIRAGEEANAQSNELLLDLDDPEAAFGELMTNIEIQQGGGFQIFGARPQQGQTTSTTGRDAQGRIVNTRDLTNQVTVIPDQNTNSLIVVTSPDNVDLIRQILEQLDRIPEQVMIETLIVEATLDSSTKLGVEWEFIEARAFGQPGASATSGTNYGLGSATPALQGFRYTIAGDKVNGFVNALKTDSRFQVLSTPRIFTSNNAEAQINISQRVPYVLSSREDPNGNLTFTYAFQDVGIVLTVTPRITANGYVTMDVVQTANDLQGFTDFNAPIINTREADTSVSVKDGETIILGGIIRSTVTSTVKKVPLLGDIPLLGNLFRSTDKKDVKTELLVFLTPRIVRDPEEAAKLREEERKKLSKAANEAVTKSLPPKPASDQSTPTTRPPSTPPPPKSGGGTH